MYCPCYCHIEHAFVNFRAVIFIISLGDDHFVELQALCHMGGSDDNAFYESRTLTGQEVNIICMFQKLIGYFSGLCFCFADDSE